MSADINVKPERRHQTLRLVSELQRERHEVWALYCQIADLKPYQGNAEIKLILNRFAEIMIDYVSLGHFGIYERLVAGTERRDQVLTNAKQIYPEFSKTTDAVVNFNDQYDPKNRKFDTGRLEVDLSELGEQLAKRMEMEDRLCELLLN